MLATNRGSTFLLAVVFNMLSFCVLRVDVSEPAHQVISFQSTESLATQLHNRLVNEDGRTSGDVAHEREPDREPTIPLRETCR